ncbi:6-hydroxy-D-nicotine oxidase [Fusarium napiforme]|uniref:6-hydroxy-D-nicotine oxidase n=1 Tax=Fusarium napiforme TaxID=42672 RepID=A0A8H5K6S6_9HYPO|nr:6-hydroxy-D-nicotine oxidase [Fusarium napiforme]
MSNSHSLPSVFQDFIAKHPNIIVTSPGDAEWVDMTKCYIKTSSSPSIVARPQDTSHVQKLVRFCVSHSVDFVVRSGGHDCTGRSQVDGALTIDMRDINHVSVSVDKKTVQIGGGIITRELTKALDAEGLITPTAPNASVGYVGWATLGGYSPLSTKYGLGVDQIVGAKYVNAEGTLVDAGEEELTAMRGGGGCLGIITEMTIKVYSLREILEGTFVFESTNRHAAWASFSNGYNKLIGSEQIPNCLSIQLTGVAIPHTGKIFTISCVWADEDHHEGRKWMTKIRALGNCIREIIKTNIWSSYCEEKEKLAGYGVYGRARTLNFKALTPKTVEILAKYNEAIPGAEVADEWALNLQRELVKHDPENILDSAYLGFVDDGEVDFKRNFGAGFETLMAVKQRVDSGNVFKNTVPRL